MNATHRTPAPTCLMDLLDLRPRCAIRPLSALEGAGLPDPSVTQSACRRAHERVNESARSGLHHSGLPISAPTSGLDEFFIRRRFRLRIQPCFGESPFAKGGVIDLRRSTRRPCDIATLRGPVATADSTQWERLDRCGDLRSHAPHDDDLVRRRRAADFARAQQGLEVQERHAGLELQALSDSVSAVSSVSRWPPAPVDSASVPPNKSRLRSRAKFGRKATTQ